MVPAGTRIGCLVQYTAETVSCVNQFRFRNDNQIALTDWLNQDAPDLLSQVVLRFRQVLQSSQTIVNATAFGIDNPAIPRVTISVDESGQRNDGDAVNAQAYVAMKLFGEIPQDRYIRNEIRVSNIAENVQQQGVLKAAFVIAMFQWLSQYQSLTVENSSGTFSTVVTRRRWTGSAWQIVHRPITSGFVEPCIRLLKSRKY